MVICTDGLANRGLGNLEQENSEAFYSEVGQIAKELGIAISVVSIKGEGCKLEVLSAVADQTQGNVKRVAPQDIAKNFASILKDEVVGTKIQLDV